MGRSLFYKSVTGHSMEQIILIRKNFPFDVQCVFKNDRFITVRVMLSNNEMYATIVYAPTYPATREFSFIIYMCI